MALNLTSQVRNIAQVTTAVANGDLSKKITVDARGEILELKDTVNTMVEQLRAFADEVTRVAREGRYRRTARRGAPRCSASPACGAISPTNVNYMADKPDLAGPQHRPRSPPPWPRETSRRRSTWTPAARSSS